MKTHPDSIFVKLSDIADLGIDGSGHLWCTDEDVSNRSNVTEFVPASAYIKLQNELVTANAQLQTQTENMLALEKERDELRAILYRIGYTASADESIERIISDGVDASAKTQPESDEEEEGREEERLYHKDYDYPCGY